MIDIEKLAQEIGRPKEASVAPVAAKEYENDDVVPDFELDDDGEEYQSVGVNGLLASTEKQLAVNRGLAEPDERDSMQFQKVLRPAALFRERVKMDSGKLARTAMYRAAKTKNLKGLTPGYFDGYINSVLIGNPLTAPLEEINMMQLVTNARRITRMGPGGLPSSDSITEEAQAIHPSQFGYLSTVEGPECSDDLTEIYTKDGWVSIVGIDEHTKLACRINGKMEFHKPERVIHERYEGKLYCVRNDNVDFRVTPNHRVFIRYSENGPEYEMVVTECYGKDCFMPDTDGLRHIAESDWFMCPYDGMVHCATVPGGMLYTRRNGSPGVWTGNSERAGIDVRVAMGVKLGSNGRLYQKVFNKRTGKMQWVSPSDLVGRVVKLPVGK